jgi:hypothetical protein
MKNQINQNLKSGAKNIQQLVECRNELIGPTMANYHDDL